MRRAGAGSIDVVAPSSAPAAATGALLLSRKCDCGMSGGPAGCSACEKKRTEKTLSRSALTGATDRDAVPHAPYAGAPLDFSRVPAGLQRKVTVSQPGDPLEIEADRIAEEVVGAAGLSPTEPRGVAGASAGLQRQAESGMDGSEDEDGDLATEEDEESEEDVADESGRPKLEPQAALEPGRYDVAVPKGGGRPLEPGARAFMEERIGRSFAHVRVHTDPEASAAARSVHAQAFTLGRDVYFGEGRYEPGTLSGRRLLAHELAHVAQQSGGVQRRLLRKKGTPAKGKTAKTSKPKPKCDTGKCGGACAPAKSLLIRHPSCGNETCGSSPMPTASSFIRHLDVNLTTQMVVAEMGSKKAATGLVGPFLSSPNPSKTPLGMHTIDQKCTPCHTNMKAEGMGWFTGFVGLEYGFHNSQKVAKGTKSHGCVRTPCSRAEWIHDNAWSGVTTVCVHKGGHCDRPLFKPSAGGGSAPEKEAPKAREPEKAAPPAAPPAPNAPLVSGTEPPPRREEPA